MDIELSKSGLVVCIRRWSGWSPRFRPPQTCFLRALGPGGRCKWHTPRHLLLVFASARGRRRRGRNLHVDFVPSFPCRASGGGLMCCEGLRAMFQPADRPVVAHGSETAERARRRAAWGVEPPEKDAPRYPGAARQRDIVAYWARDYVALRATRPRKSRSAGGFILRYVPRWPHTRPADLAWRSLGDASEDAGSGAPLSPQSCRRGPRAVGRDRGRVRSVTGKFMPSMQWRAVPRSPRKGWEMEKIDRPSAW